MKLVELLNKASLGYPDDWLKNYYHPETGNLQVIGDFGDALAKFIVAELSETFDDYASDQDQLDEANRVLNRAIRDLSDVIRALEQ